jgi:hypothetical protein
MLSSTVQHFYNTLALHTFAFAKPLLWTVRVTQFICHHNQSSGFRFYFFGCPTLLRFHTHTFLVIYFAFFSISFFVLLYYQTFITLPSLYILWNHSHSFTYISDLTTQQNTMTSYRAYLHIHSHPPCITTSPLLLHPSPLIHRRPLLVRRMDPQSTGPNSKLLAST